MRILAIGMRAQRSNPFSPVSGSKGFTLLELLLVLTLMALAAAVVAPGVFTSHASLHDEARRLRQVLQLASEEVELRGVPLRWLATDNTYTFEALSAEQEWVLLTEAPFDAYTLPEEMAIQRVHRVGGKAVSHDDGLAQLGEGADQVIGVVLWRAAGLSDLVDISLWQRDGRDDSGNDTRTIHVRPGPRGIQIFDEAHAF